MAPASPPPRVKGVPLRWRVCNPRLTTRPNERTNERVCVRRDALSNAMLMGRWCPRVGVSYTQNRNYRTLQPTGSSCTYRRVAVFRIRKPSATVVDRRRHQSSSLSSRKICPPPTSPFLPHSIVQKISP